jgi:hypothetical protein
MPTVKNVGEPCAREPHARFDVAAGGNQTSRASTRRAVQAPPADPTVTGDQVADRAEVGVDGELVPRGVVAGGLVFEIASRAGAVARRDPRHVGQIHQRVSAVLVVPALGGRLATPHSGQGFGIYVYVLCTRRRRSVGRRRHSNRRTGGRFVAIAGRWLCG